MKSLRLVLLALAGTALTSSLAFANPGLLPSHTGYPMSATNSPADGTRTSHDPGKANGVGSKASMMGASFNDADIMNDVTDDNRMRIKASKGAGRLPEIQGNMDKVSINPAGAKSTVMR